MESSGVCVGGGSADVLRTQEPRRHQGQRAPPPGPWAWSLRTPALLPSCCISAVAIRTHSPLKGTKEPTVSQQRGEPRLRLGWCTDAQLRSHSRSQTADEGPSNRCRNCSMKPRDLQGCTEPRPREDMQMSRPTPTLEMCSALGHLKGSEKSCRKDTLT